MTIDISNSPKKRAAVLVIDDEIGIRELLQSELSYRGCDVTTAVNGREALEKLAEGHYDVAFCDINMPELGGIEALEAIKRHDPEIEVIMVTGYATVETAVEAMKKGAYDFIEKPFNLEKIIALVQKVQEKGELRTMLAVYEASKAVFSSVDPNQLLPMLAELSQKLLRAENVCIMLKEEEKLRVSTWAVEVSADQQAYWVEATHQATTLMSPPFKAVVIAPTAESSGVAKEAFTGLTFLMHPLVVEKHIVGVLQAGRRDGKEWTTSDLRSATIFSSLAAQAIYNAQLYRRLQDKIAELQEARKQIEEQQAQLVQAEKLSGIGLLAAGVAHELNNPLSGIIGFTQILLEGPQLSKQQREDLETIHTQSQRCRHIIQNLLEFSRRRKPYVEPLDVVPVLEQTLRLVKYDFLTSGIDIVTHFGKNLPKIFGDGNQLQHVFLNLITNGRQAMEGKKGGILTLEVDSQQDHLVMRFRDNGCGIPKEIQSQVFDPFFTTKPAGKGTGLGLSICHGIVQQHKGSLRVESAVGEGTTFIIELPKYSPN